MRAPEPLGVMEGAVGWLRRALHSGGGGISPTPLTLVVAPTPALRRHRPRAVFPYTDAQQRKQADGSATSSGSPGDRGR